MLGWLTGKSEAQRTAGELYGRVVAAARQPRFYAEMRVPDTLEGRFEMVVLHLFLALEALRSASVGGDDEVSRLTIEAFITDMDDSMRELGVGDLTVPKKVRRAAAGFYQRAGAYRAALAAPDESALERALGKDVSGDAKPLASYVRATVAALRGARADAIFASKAAAEPI